MNRNEAETPRQWAVMVFLSGDNDLSDECVWSLKEMFRTAPDDNVKIEVLIDPKAREIEQFDVTALLQKRDKKIKSKSKAAQAAGKRDMSDHDLLAEGKSLNGAREDMASIGTLQAFIEETKQKYPNHRYLLILSGHAAGPFGNSFLVDESPAHGLSVENIRTAIGAAGRVNVLGMDSCGMGMIEIGYQLRDVADVLVASEGFELNTGWPYFNVITGIQQVVRAQPQITSAALGAEIVRQHTEYYADFLMAGVSTDISACDLSKVDEVAKAIRRLATRLRQVLPKQKQHTAEDHHKDTRTFVEDLRLSARADSDAIILAHWRAQSYRFERHVDLYDFCDLLENGCNDREIIAACAEVKAKLIGKRQKDGTYSGYVIRSCHSGDAFQYSNGAAIYFPWAEVDAGYDSLNFATDTKWRDFLREYVVKTRRRPRAGKNAGHWVGKSGEQNPFVREFPSVGIREFPSVGIREFPSVGIREFPSVGIREFPSVGIREFPSVGIRGKILDPVVKNPPDVFYEDDCKTS